MALKLTFVALLVAMASSFGPPQAADAAAAVANWWDSAWWYRTTVYRPAPYRPPQDGSEGQARVVEVAVDFPLLLAKAGEPGEFDPASLRVVQRLPAGRGRALPCALGSEYKPATRSQRSYVAWMAPPPADSSDAYDIYFDTKGGGRAKRSAPGAADLPPDNLVTNPGFDEVTDGLPTGWAVNSKPLVSLGKCAHTVGQRSLKVTVDADTPADAERQVELSQVVDVSHYAGQEMVFECDLMAERAKYGAPVAIQLEQYRADGSRIPEYAIYPRLLSIELAEGQLVQFRERGRFDPHAATVKVRLLFHCSVEDEDTGQALTGPESFLTVWLDRVVMRPAERWPWPGLTHAGFVEGAVEGAPVNRAFLFTGKRRLAFNGESDAFFNGGVFGDPKAVHWGLQAGTLELWLKPSWEAADGQEHVLFYGIAYMHRLQSQLRKLDGESGNALEFTIADADGGLHTVRGIAPLRAGQWSHLAATWDFARAQLQLFVDGRGIGQEGPGGQPWPSSLTGKDGTKGIGATAGDSRSIPMQSFIGGDSEWGDQRSAEAAIDELRISDTPRYQGSFVPSRHEFTTDEHTRALFHFDNERNGTHDSDDEFIAGYLGCELDPQEETARLEVLRDGRVVSLAVLVKPHGTAEQFERNRAKNRMKVTRPFEALPDPRFVEYRTRTVEHTVGGHDGGFGLDVGGDYQPLMRSVTYQFADPGAASTSLIPHWWANDNVLPFSVDTLKATLGKKGRTDQERAFQAFSYTLDTTNYYDADYCETLPDGRHRDRIDYTLIKALNIYPFDQCGPLNTMLRKTFLTVGILSADSPSTHHQIEQGFYDGQWRIFDLSSRLYWLDRDNETVIARRTIEDDPYLKYRQDGNPDAWLPGPASEPPIGEAVRPHNMDFHLRPGRARGAHLAQRGALDRTDGPARAAAARQDPAVLRQRRHYLRAGGGLRCRHSGERDRAGGGCRDYPSREPLR